MGIEQETKICKYLFNEKEYDIFSLLREWEKNGEDIDYSKGYEYSIAAYNLAVNGYLTESESKIDIIHKKHDEKILIKKYRITDEGKKNFEENYYNYAVALYKSNENDSTVLENVKNVLHTYFPMYKESEKLQQKISDRQKEIADRQRAINNNEIYKQGIYYLNEEKNYDTAIEYFKQIPGWRNADELIDECNIQKKEKQKKEKRDTILGFLFIFVILVFFLLITGFFD